MKSSDFYPHEVVSVEHRETHISDVFLAGDLVYKLKKAVDTGFLDFTTLEQRRLFCRREVELNRRLASGVYLGVEEITREGDVYTLAGSGNVVDYVVKMKRLDDDDNLQSMLQEHRVDEEFLLRLTDVLVNFYKESASAVERESGGGVDQILANCRENFTQLQSSGQLLNNGDKIEVIRAATESFGKLHQELLERRVEEGRIRDCHGDLKTEHVYDADGVQIIDCIEFNDRFRYQDPAADLAFLAMDMDYLGHPSKALKVLSRYVRKSDDQELMRLIDFYKCYRAMVQAKVLDLQLETLENSGDQRQETLQKLGAYIDLAYYYAVKMMQPVLWVVCGLTATGKSTVAARMAELFSITRVRSDYIRKITFHNEDDDDLHGFGKGMYSATATSLVYTKMLLEAQEELESGNSVILDATFRKKQNREEVLKLADDCHASVIFVECRCAEAEIKKRLKEREGGQGLSDARLEHWEKIKSSTDPFTELPVDTHIGLQTDRPVERCMETILAGMYELLAEQVRKILS
jgi:aminoglycoside phosphotransferase family enzyme/predicted kinase